MSHKFVKRKFQIFNVKERTFSKLNLPLKYVGTSLVSLLVIHRRLTPSLQREHFSHFYELSIQLRILVCDLIVILNHSEETLMVRVNHGGGKNKGV